jgi:threonine/homoserine/homoserine lactone efflux protein
LSLGIFFLKGMVLGFVMAVPIGPLGILCIRRTLAFGMAFGLATGFGVATADAIYGLIAGFSVSFVVETLIAHKFLLRIVGSILVGVVGWRTLFGPSPITAEEEQQKGSWLASYLSGFVLTVTNPMTILTFVAVFAGFNMSTSGGHVGLALLLFASIFTGSSLWWLTLSGSTAALRKRVTPEGMLWVNRISGSSLIVFALAIFLFAFVAD